jgi:hypothetical protein
VILCYVGNSGGGSEDYWKLFYSNEYPRMQGEEWGLRRVRGGISGEEWGLRRVRGGISVGLGSIGVHCVTVARSAVQLYFQMKFVAVMTECASTMIIF